MTTKNELPEPSPKEAEKLTSVAKLNFRSWLWLQWHDKSEFATLARMILGGGPENVWANKPLKAAAVCFDIEQMYASGRGGISAEIRDLASRAVDAYRADDRSVSDLIREQETVQAHAERDFNSQLMDRVAEETAEIGLEIPTRMKALRLSEGGLVQVKCEHRKRNGRPCRRWALPGQVTCDLHGGTYLTEEEIKETLQTGQERLIEASASAIDTVIDIMQNSVRDEVRLKAAEMLLDRTGFRAGMDINHRSGEQVQKNAVDELNDRLNRLMPQVIDQDGKEITS